jgi:hypothetical protein
MTSAPTIANATQRASKTGGTGKEIAYWIFFSVLISLAQLWLIPILCYLAKKPWTLVGLIGDGSLLFFATSITSKTGGEYFKKVKGHHEWLTFGCVVTMVGIIVLSVFVFSLEAAIRLNLMPANSLSPERVTHMSIGLAGSGILFSLAYTLFIHNLANEGK